MLGLFVLLCRGIFFVYMRFIVLLLENYVWNQFYKSRVAWLLSKFLELSSNNRVEKSGPRKLDDKQIRRILQKRN